MGIWMYTWLDGWIDGWTDEELVIIISMLNNVEDKNLPSNSLLAI